jgi:hypothetical protein
MQSDPHPPPPPPVWRAIGLRDRAALQDLNNSCFPLRYEEEFYDSACGEKPGVLSVAAFEHGAMVAAIVVRFGPASNFEDSVVSTWNSWSSWDDPVSECAASFFRTLVCDFSGSLSCTSAQLR